MQLITTTPIIELGDVKSGTRVDFKFNVTNNSLNEIILVAKASCGCTVPTLEKTKMGPMECQTGKGTYRASKHLGKIQNKTVKVMDNQGNALTIKLNGNVI